MEETSKTKKAMDEKPVSPFPVSDLPFKTEGLIDCVRLQVYHPVQGDIDGSAEQSWHIKKGNQIFVDLSRQFAHIVKRDHSLKTIRSYFCVPMSNVCWFQPK